MDINEIFNDFKTTNYSEWLEKIEADLKGKPISVLSSSPEPDLEIVAYHHAENIQPKPENGVARNLNRPDNSWKIRQLFDNNSKMLTALNEGVNAVGLRISHSTNLQELTKDVAFQHITSDIRFEDKTSAINTSVPVESHLNYDAISMNLKEGSWKTTLADFFEFYQKQHKNKSLWISGSDYGAAGASTVQELAFTIAHVNEYIQYLHDQGISLDELNEKLIVELSVNENYFVNIAKFRVIKDLIQLVFKGYDASYEITSPIIYAKTNLRHLAQNDKNNNPLRQTTQAMSAVIGGCDVLTIDYGKFGTPQEIERFERIAKNIQLVLKEEAYLDKVVDPSGGSYTIEALSEQLLSKSWELFLEVEKAGGLIESAKHNRIQDKIETTKKQLVTDLVSGNRTFLGVNKHPNASEPWIDLNPTSTDSGTAFKALSPFYLENYFTKKLANHE